MPNDAFLQLVRHTQKRTVCVCVLMCSHVLRCLRSSEEKKEMKKKHSHSAPSYLLTIIIINYLPFQHTASYKQCACFCMPIAHIFSPNGMPWESRIGQETFFSHFWLSQECSKEMHCHDARCESQANKNVRTHNSTTITIIIIKEVDGVTQPTVCGVCVKMVAELSCRYCNMLLCYVNALRMLLQCLHRHRFRCLSHKHTAPPHCSACTETRHNDEGRPKSVLSVCISLSLSLFRCTWIFGSCIRRCGTQTLCSPEGGWCRTCFCCCCLVSLVSAAFNTHRNMMSDSYPTLSLWWITLDSLLT